MSTWRWRGRTADTALVLAVGLVALVGLVVQAGGIDTAAEWAALLAVLASSGALVVRRRHPVPVGMVALAAVDRLRGAAGSARSDHARVRRGALHRRRRGPPRRRHRARCRLGRRLRRRRQLRPEHGERGDVAPRRLAHRRHRRRDPQPPGLPRRGAGPNDRRRAADGGGGPPAGHRGAVAHRPRTARRARPPPLADQRAGQCRAAPPGPRPVRAGAHRDQADEQGDAAGVAHDAGGAAPGGRRAARTRPGPPRRSGHDRRAVRVGRSAPTSPRPGRCRRTSTWRRTGSSRRRSPT